MNRKRSILLVLAIFIIAGCQTLNVNAKPWAQQTPKEKANFMLGVYNAQYDDTMRMASAPISTPAQKQIVVKKKAILTQIRPLLTVYLVMVDSGMKPTPEDEAALLALINQLATIGG